MAAPPRALQGKSRFDDPMIDNELDQGGFAILYVGTDPKSVFLEVLSQFRKSISEMQDLANEMVLDVPDRDRLIESGGLIPESKLAQSQLATAKLMSVAPVFDLADPEAVQSLRIHLAPSLIAMGLNDLDFGELLGSNRTLTQAISRWIWSMKSNSGEPLFSGIRYRSRFDPEGICLALYQDRFSIDGNVTTQPISGDSPGFAGAASILRLKIA